MRGGYIPKIEVACFRSDLPEPQIEKSDDVKIKVQACGICGSEVHAYLGVHPFRIPPLVSGHEVAGIVVEVGKNVAHFKAGDRVCVEPQYGCGECWYCKHDLYNLCTSKKVLGSGGWSGGLGEYIVTPERTVVDLPDNLSFEQGALIETVANGMYAVRHTEIGTETNIVVMGTGPIGVGDYLCAKLYNPKKIVMVDISDFNLQKVRELGCECTINSKNEDLYQRVMDFTDGVGADVTILAYGDEPTLVQACDITRRGGTVVQHALMRDGLSFPYRVHQQHELEFKAYNMYQRKDFELVCKAAAEGFMDLDKLISHKYPIEKFKEAMYMAHKRPEPVLKVMMEF